jgi:hypothetical protein
MFQDKIDNDNKFKKLLLLNSSNTILSTPTI